MHRSPSACFSSADFLLRRQEFPQRATFNHWQLKDLVCCPEAPYEVLFPMMPSASPHCCFSIFTLTSSLFLPQTIDPQKNR